MSPSQFSPLDLDQFDGHTPGPWCSTIIGHSRGFSASIVGDDAHVEVCRVDSPRGREDARLIASAPALLAECKRLQAECARLRAALVLSVEALEQFGKNFPVSGIKASIKSSEGFSQNLTHAAAGTALNAARAALAVQENA